MRSPRENRSGMTKFWFCDEKFFSIKTQILCQSNLHTQLKPPIFTSPITVMSGLTQGLDVLSLASQVDIDTQTTLDSVLENADAATLLRSAIGEVGHEESQDPITAERLYPVREYSSSDEGNGNDNDHVGEPRTEQYPSQHHGFQVENPLPLQPEGNSQQNELHYAPYPYPSQANGYPIPTHQQTYPPLQYAPTQNFQGQNYAGAYVHQYPPQYVAQSLTGPHGPMLHPQYPNAQPPYPPTYPQGYPVHASTAGQPVPQPSQTNPGRRRKKDDQEHKHPCEICTKRFLRPSALVSHMRTHTGEKPFPCRFAGCDRSEAFSVKSNRTRHEGKHIRDEMPPPPEVLQEINARRAKNGMAPLTIQGSS
jgi:Zinc finger, C2H2 type